MRCRTMINTLVLVLFTLTLVGCGQKDDGVEVKESTQTTALVPGSVTEGDLGDAAASSETEVEPAHDHQTPVADVSPVEESVPAGDSGVTEVEPVVRNVVEEHTPPPAADTSGQYSLQLGSFTVLAIAQEKAADLRKLGHPATVEQAEVGGQLYHRLFIRGIADRKSAENLGEELHSGHGFSYLVKRK